MHFRMRENVVQLIRTTYDPDTKRGKPQLLGTVPRRTMALSEQMAAKLTTEEAAEFEAFARNYRNSIALQAKVHGYQLCDIVRQAIDAAEAAEGADRDLIISNLTLAAQDIRRFLSRKR